MMGAHFLGLDACKPDPGQTPTSVHVRRGMRRSIMRTIRRARAVMLRATPDHEVWMHVALSASAFTVILWFILAA
jgi:hypothetical protein